MTEQRIHRAIIRHLEARASPKVFWCHIPNGGFRRRVEGLRLLEAWQLLRGVAQ
jgi:hypothetical protein